MEKYVKAIPIVGIALAVGLPLSANADTTWNGFITVGGGFSSPDDDATSLRGYEEDFTFDNETVLGLQLRSPISEKLSATGQIVARGNEDYATEVAWAYVSYEASESTTLRLGRFRTPFYLYSDYLEVGYAYHWISPPTDVYGLPADSIDGVDIVYETLLGPIDTGIQFYAGSVDSDFTESGALINTKIRNQTGLAVTLNKDWLTFRASHHVAQKVSFNGLEDIFVAESIGTIGDLADTLNNLSIQTTNSGYAQAAFNLSVQDVKFTFDEIALKAEWNNLLAVTEFTQLEADSGPLGTQHRMLATLGYTFGSVMLHVTHANSDDDIAPISDPIPLDTPTAAQLAGVVNAVANNLAAPSRTANTIGLRWDFETSAAFKVEYTDIEDDNGANGNIFQFAIDLVF